MDKVTYQKQNMEPQYPHHYWEYPIAIYLFLGGLGGGILFLSWVMTAFVFPGADLAQALMLPNFAALIAIAMWVILNRTTFGYELKACGFNKNASIYAGIDAKRNIVLSMVISGALAGLGGGLYYLAGTADYTIQKTLLSMGFNGISVALLATSNPIGTIFSALFISYIQVGGESLQPTYAKEMIDIIIAVIIYLSAFALLTKTIISRFIRTDKSNVNAEPAPAAPVAAAAKSNESEGQKA